MTRRSRWCNENVHVIIVGGIFAILLILYISLLEGMLMLRHFYYFWGKCQVILTTMLFTLFLLYWDLTFTLPLHIFLKKGLTLLYTDWSLSASPYFFIWTKGTLLSVFSLDGSSAFLDEFFPLSLKDFVLHVLRST